MNQGRKPYKFDMPAGYRIRIEGLLDQRWSECLCGMAISSASRPGEPTVTSLTGELTDMAALMGVLNTVYDLGFTLLQLERLAGAEEEPALAAEVAAPAAPAESAGTP